MVVLAVVVTHLACDHWGTSPTLCCWQALRNAAKSDGVGREDVIIWCPPGTTTSMCLKLAAAHNLGCKSGSTQRDVGQAEASFVCVWGGGEMCINGYRDGDFGCTGAKRERWDASTITNNIQHQDLDKTGIRSRHSVH